MKAIDLYKSLEDDIVKACDNNENMRRHPGHDLRVYLFSLRKENMPLCSCESKLLNKFVEYYTNARSDPIPDFGRDEFLTYMSLLNSIKSAIVPQSTHSKSNSPSCSYKKKSNKFVHNNSREQTLSVKSLSGSPTKVNSSFQTQIVQDDSKRKNHETCV